MAFNDVKVLVGDNLNPASDASYKKLLWKNLPVPDIFFHTYTPTIVSLEKQTTIQVKSNSMELKFPGNNAQTQIQREPTYHTIQHVVCWNIQKLSAQQTNFLQEPDLEIKILS